MPRDSLKVAEFVDGHIALREEESDAKSMGKPIRR